ncbi:MAG TPA: hypothetical protein VNB94_10790 [Mycobacteriales bacterium]|nr:hypothetical protein [Mycobacteriales bacterium]
MSRRPDPPPLETDDVRTVLIGTAAWVLTGLALLPFYGALDSADRLWWLWACGAGATLGLLGLYYCRRRERAIARDAMGDEHQGATSTGRSAGAP